MKGSTIKRGSTWTCYWSTTDPATGKRRQHSKGGFRIQKDARAHLNSIMEAVGQGAWKPDAKLTVKGLLEDHWLPAKRSEGLRPATIDQYQSVVDAWILPHLAELDVRQLTPAKVGALVEMLRASGSTLNRGGLSGRSVQLVVTVLKAATAWSVIHGLSNRDALAGYKRPRVQTKVMTAWSTAEARSFLAAAAEDRLAAAWSLLLVRGLRRGELAGLAWDAVDLEAGVLRIVATRVVVDGKAIDSTPKTSAGRRTVPLDQHLVTALRAHWDGQMAERLAAGEAWAGTGHVFVNELGEPYHPDYFSDRFDKLTRAVKLRRIRLHDTRHTAASLMLASGVQVKVVSEMLGHSSPTITLSIYAHTLPGMAETAGEALSASLLG
jgi:integrase